MIDKILILDTETTGVDEGASCIEVACILYSVKHAAPMQSFASLIRSDSNEAENVNGILPAMLATALRPCDVWNMVGDLVNSADAFIAHNAEFDIRFVPTDVGNRRAWICSCHDLDWPRAPKPGASLVTLALAHGLGVSHAHRAMADCDLLSRLLTRVHEMGVDLQVFLARGLRPKATFQALVSFDDRELAKAAGFQWDGATKRWTRRMAIEDAAELPFRTREVKL